MVVDEYFLSGVSASYHELVVAMPESLRIMPPLIAITLFILLFGFFTLFFYKVIAKRDLMTLNLAKYNHHEHSHAHRLKLRAFIFYMIRYLTLTPILILVWFIVFSLFMIILAKDLDINTIMLVSAGLVLAIRLSAYFDEELAEDLAKLFPLTLLTVVLITPGFFDIQTTLNRFLEIPLFFNNVLNYLIVIAVLEIIMRIIYLPHAIIGPDDLDEDDE